MTDHWVTTIRDSLLRSHSAHPAELALIETSGLSAARPDSTAWICQQGLARREAHAIRALARRLSPDAAGVDRVGGVYGPDWVSDGSACARPRPRPCCTISDTTRLAMPSRSLGRPFCRTSGRTADHRAGEVCRCSRLPYGQSIPAESPTSSIRGSRLPERRPAAARTIEWRARRRQARLPPARCA